jgi:hypothetical protein
MSYRTIEIEKGNLSYAALNPIASKIYISYESSNLILIVNIQKGEIERKISANRPRDIDTASTYNKVYVAAAYGVYEIDGTTNQSTLINKRPQISSQYVGILESPSSLKDHLFAIDSITNRVYVSKYEDESVYVYNGNESNRLEDSINFKESKWNLLSSSTTKPSFVLVNEDLRLLYVKADVEASAGGGGYTAQHILVVDLNTKKTVKSRSLPSTKTQIGFALNRRTNSVYMKKSYGKAILKYDGYLKKVVCTTVLGKSSLWKRISADYSYFAEIIVTNPKTNKVYVSDSKCGLLYEIEG